MGAPLIITDEKIGYLKFKLRAEQSAHSAVRELRGRSTLIAINNSYSCEAFSIEKTDSYHVLLCRDDKALYIVILVYGTVENPSEIMSEESIRSYLSKVQRAVGVECADLAVDSVTIEVSQSVA